MSASLLSQFEEKFDEMNGVQPSGNFPLGSSCGSNENPVAEVSMMGNTGVESGALVQDVNGMNSEIYESQDSGGMMKILPSDVDVSASCD